MSRRKSERRLVGVREDPLKAALDNKENASWPGSW